MSPPSARPLTGRYLSRLRPLKSTRARVPTLTLNLSTFFLPRGGKTSLVRVRRGGDILQLRASLPGNLIRHRVPFEKIRAEKLDGCKLRGLPRSRLRRVPDAVRPAFLPVTFLPRRVKLGRHE